MLLDRLDGCVQKAGVSHGQAVQVVDRQAVEEVGAQVGGEADDAVGPVLAVLAQRDAGSVAQEHGAVTHAFVPLDKGDDRGRILACVLRWQVQLQVDGVAHDDVAGVELFAVERDAHVRVRQEIEGQLRGEVRCGVVTLQAAQRLALRYRDANDRAGLLPRWLCLLHLPDGGVVGVAADPDPDQGVVGHGCRLPGELVSQGKGEEAAFAVAAVQDAFSAFGMCPARLPSGAERLEGGARPLRCHAVAVVGHDDVGDRFPPGAPQLDVDLGGIGVQGVPHQFGDRGDLGPLLELEDLALADRELELRQRRLALRRQLGADHVHANSVAGSAFCAVLPRHAVTVPVSLSAVHLAVREGGRRAVGNHSEG